MHSALPPRKPTQPPQYVAARTGRLSYYQRGRLRHLVWVFAGILFVLVVWRNRGGAESIHVQKSKSAAAKAPKVVIVTALDSRHSDAAYEKLIKDNRREYANLYGYETFTPPTKDYDVTDPISPSTWARIPAMRHAMTLYPHTRFFFYLDQRALIMNPSLSLEYHILNPERLEPLMIPDQPIVPSSSVIRTLRGRRPEHTDLILTQDREGLSTAAFIVRGGEWAKFFLDAWYDPLYRSYNFRKAESHALEHLVQWHGTILSRLGLIPQKIMNSYTAGIAGAEAIFEDGDFIAHLHDCDAKGRSCLQEARPLYDQFSAALKRFQAREQQDGSGA